MKTYVALLRGINVVGANNLPMERLRARCSALGFKDVRTYIQTGNVVFRSEASKAEVQGSLERMLKREMKKPVVVVLRTPAELAKILKANPYLDEAGVDVKHLHVSFLTTKASAEAVTALSRVQSGRDRFAARGKELFLHCPDGFGTSKLAAAHERVLRVATTVRNWNTVTKLLEMAIIT